MGRRGPSPKPTALRILQGNPGKIGLNPHEPKPPQAAIDLKPPAFLSAAAKQVWSRLVPDLRAAGLLTSIDVDLLAAYCATFSRWREAENFLKKNGLTFDAGDYPQQYPQVAISHKSIQLLAKLGAELGLSPAARSRIQVEFRYGASTPATPKPPGSAAENAKRIFG